MLYEEVFVPSIVDEVECVPLECRPNGYDKYIKPALGCMLTAHSDDTNYKYHTIVHGTPKKVFWNIANCMGMDI